MRNLWPQGGVNFLPPDPKENPMKRLFSAIVAAAFAFGSVSVMACPGEKAADDKQMSTPSKPKA
jgi:hypothetical protein